MADNPYLNLRVWATTVHKLKILAAHKGQSMIRVLDELIEAELKRMKIKVADDPGTQDSPKPHA